MVEFDKMWPGENQRNKTDGGECINGLDSNGQVCVDRCQDGKDVETGKLCGEAAEFGETEEEEEAAIEDSGVFAEPP